MTFEELLIQNGRLIYTTSGSSMQPMLKSGRDLVVIEPPRSRLRKYDVALYQTGGKYYLHRVVRVLDDHYLIRGDHTYQLESVPDGAILGVLTEFRRKGRLISVNDPIYQLYARVWNALYPLRQFLTHFRRVFMRTGRYYLRFL